MILFKHEYSDLYEICLVNKKYLYIGYDRCFKTCYGFMGKTFWFNQQKLVSNNYSLLRNSENMEFNNKRFLRIDS